ncbi:MAG: methyltransferase domain-containing protein [Arcobacteraceae bacterium]|jgi:ubiquinone/menaquinone biosynthesis C-methylase UbiE|nr:methyltransferase domain-containing protein [Arcobacteraceae bacterium]
MFFPKRIKSIKKTDKVLEIGPGNTPFYRSDILLEKVFLDDEETFLQAGGTQKIDLKKDIIYFTDNVFPFKDKEFNYTICSHVLEHIPKDDLSHFIKELERVSINGGYIEVPSYSFELLTSVKCHLSLIYADSENTLHFLYKEDFDLHSESYERLRESMIKIGLNSHLIPLNLDIFGYGFEHKNNIKYKVHKDASSFFDIVNQNKGIVNIIWSKNIKYYLQKVLEQFNQNIFKQKIYNKFKVSLK